MSHSFFCVRNQFCGSVWAYISNLFFLWSKIQMKCLEYCALLWLIFSMETKLDICGLKIQENLGVE